MLAYRSVLEPVPTREGIQRARAEAAVPPEIIVRDTFSHDYIED